MSPNESLAAIGLKVLNLINIINVLFLEKNIPENYGEATMAKFIYPYRHLGVVFCIKCTQG
ncbi:MAG: hypothetical protein A4E66_01085 [Syntrophus sp. PtaB.Bin001]|nr:MAG: hypothetical protein A4E66_01085 [Syntrophus sp. PtaB.Bin001]